MGGGVGRWRLAGDGSPHHAVLQGGGGVAVAARVGGRVGLRSLRLLRSPPGRRLSQSIADARDARAYSHEKLSQTAMSFVV